MEGEISSPSRNNLMGHSKILYDVYNPFSYIVMHSTYIHAHFLCFSSQKLQLVSSKNSSPESPKNRG